MPLFTVTMKSNRSTNEKDRLSKASRSASIVAGYPEDDLFQRFLSSGSSDLKVDLYYSALPKPRPDQMLMIEVLVSSGTDTKRKKGIVAALVEKLGEAGIATNDIVVFFLETDRASGSFGERLTMARSGRYRACEELVVDTHDACVRSRVSEFASSWTRTSS